MIVFFATDFKGYHKIFDFIFYLGNYIRVIFPYKGTVANNGWCGGMIPILPIMGVGEKNF